MIAKITKLVSLRNNYFRQFSLNDLKPKDDQIDLLRREMEGRKYLDLEQKGKKWLLANPRFS